MNQKENMVQELKTLPIGLIIGGSLIIAAALICFGMIAAAAMLSISILALATKPEEPKPRLVSTVASKPKVILGGRVMRRYRF